MAALVLLFVKWNSDFAIATRFNASGNSLLDELLEKIGEQAAMIKKYEDERDVLIREC